MTDFNDIPGGLRIPSQIPLNIKEWVKDEATLSYLGVNNNLAFTYHDNIKIFCKQEKTLYVWREVQSGEENTGLIPLDFTYPANTITADVNYSNKTYNFFKVETPEFLIENSITSVGEGEDIYKGFNEDTKKHEIKSIKSNTLSITNNNEEVIIDIASSSQIPALYVNNLYEPTYEEWLAENKAQNSGTAVVGFEFIGKGTLAQPFTDTIVYTLNAPLTPAVVTPNTAIQNALDAYVGTGLGADGINPASRLNPKLKGQKIIIQNNNSNYIFNNNLNYSNLNLVHECNVNYTTLGYLIDMDDNTSFDSENSKITLEIKEGVTVQVNGNGFRNSGNTSTTPPSYTSGRICILIGDGEIYNDYNGVDVLTKYIFNGNGNNNDDQLHFQVRCKVRALYQGIYKTVNKMRIDFYNQLTSGIFLGNINTNIKAFHMEGGQVRFYEKGSIALSSETSGRLYGITFNPIEDCYFQLNSAKVTGTSENCFVKLADGNVYFLAFNSPSGNGFATTLVGTSTINNGLFENLGSTPWGVEFKNNVFSYTGINFDKVDLTRGNGTSSINFIGGDVIETLVVFNSKANAISAGRAKGSKILKRVTVNMANFVSGVEYQISALGTGVNWTSIGASAGTLGVYFTYNGVTATGSGGQATQSSIEIL